MFLSNLCRVYFASCPPAVDLHLWGILSSWEFFSCTAVVLGVPCAGSIGLLFIIHADIWRSHNCVGHSQYYCVWHVSCRVCFACSVPAMVFFVMWVFVRVCHMRFSWWFSASWPHGVLGFVFVCRWVSHALHVCKWFHLWYRWGFVCTYSASVCCLGIYCRCYGLFPLILCLHYYS